MRKVRRACITWYNVYESRYAFNACTVITNFNGAGLARHRRGVTPADVIVTCGSGLECVIKLRTNLYRRRMSSHTHSCTAYAAQLKGTSSPFLLSPRIFLRSRSAARYNFHQRLSLAHHPAREVDGSSDENDIRQASKCLEHVGRPVRTYMINAPHGVSAACNILFLKQYFSNSKTTIKGKYKMW